MWYVYIIKSHKKKCYYVGSTNQPERRLNEHNKKKVQSTKAYVPFSLVYQKIFDTEIDARTYEHLIKSKRKLKEEIIRKIENK